MPNFDFLDSLSNPNISLLTIVFSLLFAFALGLVIAWVYKKTNQGFSYDRSFGFTLVMITVIVNSIMITIGSNIALSLGLIGSLSIIRFRTAIKNSMDMAFLFWCIAVGLAIGAYQYPVALAVTLIVGLVILLFNYSGFFSRANTDYVLTVHVKSAQNGKEIAKELTDHHLKWQLKSSFANEEGGEMTYSIYASKRINIDELMDAIKSLENVKNVSLLSPGTNLFI